METVEQKKIFLACFLIQNWDLHLLCDLMYKNMYHKKWKMFN